MSIDKLFIPFEEYTSVGGPTSFMGNLRRFLQARGHAWAASPKRARGIFFPIQYDHDVLRYVKESGGAIIQRLDGIWYPEKHGAGYRRLNQPVAEIYRHMASHVVFQSEYSKRQCFAMFGALDDERHSVILNGVDAKLFLPSDSAWDGASTVRFVTTGNFRHRAMLEPIVLALDSLASELALELHVAGPISDELRHVCDRPYVHRHGACQSQQVAELLRRSHLFVYSHLNPPCPNSVIEAIATGLPVTGFASGAMTEILPFGTDLLAPVSDDLFQTERQFDASALASSMRHALSTYASARARALQHRGAYDFEKTGTAYLAVFERQMREAAAQARCAPRMRRWIRSKGFDRFVSICRRLRLDTAAVRFVNEFLRALPETEFRRCVSDALADRLEHATPSGALKTLFAVDRANYEVEGKQAIRYGNGTHTKHRHIHYHTFFTNRLTPGDRILDIGCGRGELAYDMAIASGNDGFVWGIDRRQSCIEHAQSRYSLPQLKFVLGDATEQLPLVERVRVITLSNVLEHLSGRPAFLSKLAALYRPDRFLVRVPCYERDWRIPLMDEMGVDYRLDAEHEIEYRFDQFISETQDAGLRMAEAQCVWGEIWAVLEPCPSKHT